jgi:hypothetical protein
MKWALLGLELLMLFFANNVLFLLPGGYDWFNFVAAAVAVTIAAVSAWFSGKIFSGRRLRERVKWQEMLKAPPGIVWVSVVLAFCLAGLMKIPAR